MDPATATNRLVDSLGTETLARAAAYTHGNHWLLLVSFLISVGVAYVIARTGLLSRLSTRFRERPNRGAFLCAGLFMLGSSVLSLPYTVYADWIRQHAYNRSSQPLGDFLGQWLIGVLIGALLGALVATAVYALLRRGGQRWRLWATGTVTLLAALTMVAAPILIEPLFNHFDPLPGGAVREAIVPMAIRAGVPTDRIFVYDGSRQSNNFTANAGGIGRSARIAISDVALKGATLAEVRAVTGHEIGHYVLHHSLWGVLMVAVLTWIGLWLAERGFPAVARKLGVATPLTDPAGLPALAILLSILGFVATPVTNSVSRQFESDADRYSLDTVGEPEGLATALVKTAEYRNPRPTALEEILFYDHPSVERRVRAAMEYEAAHPAPTADAGTH
jgi:STE24 endopeptidase